MVNMFDKMRINDLNYGLNTLSEQSNVISKNIANADTPFYKSEKLVFKESDGRIFSQEKMPLIVTDKMHIQPKNRLLDPSSFTRYQNNMSPRNDFNDVNLDLK